MLLARLSASVREGMHFGESFLSCIMESIHIMFKQILSFVWSPWFGRRAFSKALFFVATMMVMSLFGFSASPAHASLEDGLVGHWTFDEESGVTASDSSGLGNHTTVNGTQGWVDGPIGGAFQFDGSTRLDPVATNSIPIGNESYTIATWFRTTAPAMRGFVGWGNYGTDNQVTAFRLADEGSCPANGGINNYWWGNDLIACGSTSVIDNEWHHAAVTYNGTTRRLYIDGVEMVSDNPGVHAVPSTANFAIGRTASMFNEYLIGGMDDLRIYNRGLLESEIESLFDAADFIPPAAPSAFSAAASASTVSLSWTNPIVDFHSVTIRRSVSGFPVSVTDGTSVVSGNTGTNLTDTALSDGTYFYSIFARDVEGNFSSAATATVTVDATSPLISSVISAIGSTTTTIAWTTDELASSKVIYGPNTQYASSTTEGDVSPRVLSHSVSLDRLSVCTFYYYKVVSRDAAGNAVTSTGDTFTTSGCPGDATVSEMMLEQASVSVTTTVSLTDGDHAVSLEAPAGFTSTSSQITFQIKSLDMTTVLGGLGRPGATLYQASPVVFDLKALIDAGTTLDTFNLPITITYRYSSSDFTGLRESTLWVYHYHGGMWAALDVCVQDMGARTLTCTTRGFSTFGLFGQAQPVDTGGLVAVYGCTDRSASNYDPRATISNIGSCRPHISSSAVTTPVVISNPVLPVLKSVSTSSNPLICTTRLYPTKPIRYGAKNDSGEVKLLERFLNASEGKHLPVDGKYSKEDMAAVIAWQEKYAKDILKPWGITKGTGYVFSQSLKKMQGLQKEMCLGAASER